MKKLFALLLLLSLSLSLFSCVPLERGDDSSSESASESESESASETEEVYDPSHVDYSLDVYAFATDREDARVLVVSDNHFRAFSGIGGYTDDERQQLLMDILIATYNNPDTAYECVIFNGDIANQNDALRNGLAENYVQMWQETYASQLTAAGVPCFAVNASHDSLYEDEFYEIFDHPKNYVVLVGKTAYICVDAYNGERTSTYETAATDLTLPFVRECERFLAHGYVDEAFIVCHWPKAGTNYKRLLGNEKVLATVSGHTHYNEVVTESGKPLLQTGHFSRAYTKMQTWGLGFKPFVPVPKEGNGRVVDENGNERADYSATGSPWQYRVFEQSADAIESYIVYPEMTYKACSSDGIHFEAFTQEYTEARPSFLGDAAPIDKSYKKFETED